MHVMIRSSQLCACFVHDTLQTPSDASNLNQGACSSEAFFPLHCELLEEEMFLVRFGVSLILEEFLGCIWLC